MEFRSLWESGRACPITLRSGINGKPISISIREKKEDGVERRKEGKAERGRQGRLNEGKVCTEVREGGKFPRGKDGKGLTREVRGDSSAARRRDATVKDRGRVGE